VRSDGTGDREVVSGRFVRSPAWSPDGSRIAFFGRFDDGPWHIYTINADGSGLETLTSGSRFDRNPNWSPDGTKIVFVRGGQSSEPAENEIHVLDVATGEVSEPLTSNEVQDGNPVWSPDGTEIAFYRARGEGYRLWLMNADGSDQVDLMRGWVGANLDPMWR
jgi:Tol biopolymer transport system component